MLTDKMKNELVERIKTADRIDRIILFGSEAAGTAGPDSDIDLLVYTRPEFEKIKASDSIFIRRVLREGIELSWKTLEDARDLAHFAAEAMDDTEALLAR